MIETMVKGKVSLFILQKKTIKDTIIPNINRKIELKKDKPAPKPKKIVISNVQHFPKLIMRTVFLKTV